MAKKINKTTRTAKAVTAQINNVWLKIYAEQCDHFHCDDKGVTTLTPAQQKQCICDTLQQLSLLSDYLPEWSFHAICHYKDTYIDVKENDPDFASKIKVPACEKPHAHVLLFSNTYDKYHHFKRARLGTVLNALEKCGIAFRDGIDNSIMCDFVYGDRKDYCLTKEIVYHTHETISARETDGKEIYDRSECVTNISLEQLQEYYDEYDRIFFRKADRPPTKARELKEYYYRQAFDCGYKLGDFNTFWTELCRQHGNTLVKSKIYEGYQSGVDCICNSHLNDSFPVCCIFIHGCAGLGKTVCAHRALERLYANTDIYTAPDNTGAFDMLLPNHKAILFDDYNHKLDILKLCDTGRYDKRAYRRGSNNPRVLAHYLIFTHNKNLGEYCRDVYNDIYINYNTWNAFKSRFYYVDISNDLSIRDNFMSRGLGDYKKDADEMYKRFMHYFREEINKFNTWRILGDLSEFEDFC